MSGPDLPAGFVDPTDLESVAAVLRSVVEATGVTGLADLLARLPGTRVEAGTPGGPFRRAEPGRVWLGEERYWTMTDPPALVQVVGGVVLHRDRVDPGRAAALVAPVVVEQVRRTGSVTDASAVLSAARDTLT